MQQLVASSHFLVSFSYLFFSFSRLRLPYSTILPLPTTINVQGCGKTWTMQGVLEVQELRGVIPCAFDHIFEHIGSKPTTKFLTRACYLEIYNEQVMDSPKVCERHAALGCVLF
jgi:hypothetical protein